jgi:predicted small integral membrane protein
MDHRDQALPTAGTRRGVQALIWTLRATRNVLALLGVFFVYLLWHGYSAYEAEMAASSQDVACVKSARCM